jgi:hypothetical protein
VRARRRPARKVQPAGHESPPSHGNHLVRLEERTRRFRGRQPRLLSPSVTGGDVLDGA